MFRQREEVKREAELLSVSKNSVLSSSHCSEDTGIFFKKTVYFSLSPPSNLLPHYTRLQ